MVASARPTVYAVDAGGSRTVVAIFRAGEPVETWERESFALASAGEVAARTLLATVLDNVRTALASGSGNGLPAYGCIASSSMPFGEEAPPPQQLLEVAPLHAPTGQLVMLNDVVPPLWHPALNGVGIVVCSGTGSSVVGRNAANVAIKVGGHEHIVSDQGSAYSIAREGLRAAARDFDGTGPSTKLRADAEAHFQRPMPALGRWLAELPRARTTVAAFAPFVTAAADRADHVARGIVMTEAGALASATRAAASRLGVETLPTLALTGGLLRTCRLFREAVTTQLTRLGLTDTALSDVHVIDGIDAARAYATRLAIEGTVPEGVVVDVG